MDTIGSSPKPEFDPRNQVSVVRSKRKKLALLQLESFLPKDADILRKTGMNASEYKRFPFAMLFLKRLSDQFGADVEAVQACAQPEGHSPKVIARLLENKKGFGSWVPERARWELGSPLTLDNDWQLRGLMHVKEHVGDVINKALAAIEEDNAESLSGVLKPPNFVATKGDNKLQIDDSIEARPDDCPLGRLYGAPT